MHFQVGFGRDNTNLHYDAVVAEDTGRVSLDYQEGQVSLKLLI